MFGRKSTVLSILAVLFILGCVSNNISFDKTDNLKDISQDTQTFMNKAITIEGRLDQLFYMPEVSVKWKYYIVDGQGYKFPINLPLENRDFYIGKTYRVSGIVKKLEYCTCQKRYVDINGDDFAENGQKLSLQYMQNWNCPIIYYDITNKWRDVSYNPEKQISSSCMSPQTKQFNCSFGYITNFTTWKAETINFSFKDEYRCNPETLDSIYYIDSQTMTKLGE